MKSHVKRSRADRLLGDQLLDAVLADQLDARVGQHRQVGGLDVLDGGEQLDGRRPCGPSARAASAIAARAAARFSCTTASSTLMRAHSRDRRSRPGARCRAPSRRWEWKRSGSQIVHRPGDDDLARARALERAPRARRADRRRPPAHDVVAEALAQLPGDVLADLVAAGRRRPARRRPRSPRPTRPAAASSTPAASPRQPAWTTASRSPPAATSAAVRQSAPCAITGRPGCRSRGRRPPASRRTASR